MAKNSINIVLDKLTQAHLMYYAKTIVSKFTKKIVYKDQRLNQKVLDFGTLFSSFNFPIVIEFELASDDYYSYDAMREYLEAFKKAKKEKSYDRAVDEAVKEVYNYLNHLIKVCDSIKKVYEDAFKKAVGVFNKSFGFNLLVPKKLPRILLHISYLDPSKRNAPVDYNKDINVFDVYPVIFSLNRKYHTSLFAKEIAKLLVNDPVYMVKVDDLRRILLNIEKFQSFQDVFLDDLKIFFKYYITFLKRLGQTHTQYSKIIDSHITKLNKEILKITQADNRDYKLFNKSVGVFNSFVSKEENFLKNLSEKTNDVQAYLLKNKVKELTRHKGAIEEYSKTLLDYDQQSQIVMKTYLGKFYLVFMRIFTTAYRAPSLHLERFKDKNLDAVYKFYKSRNDSWNNIFVTTKALEELNQTLVNVYSFHKFIRSIFSYPAKGV